MSRLLICYKHKINVHFYGILDMKRGTRNACYHHSINEPTKVVELEPQEQNIWNTKLNQSNDNVFYAKHMRNKASSASSVDQYGQNVNHNIRNFCPSDQNIHVSISDDPAADMHRGKVCCKFIKHVFFFFESI